MNIKKTMREVIRENPNLKLKEIPYLRDKRKYWCKIVLQQLETNPLSVAIETANKFIEEYDSKFENP